MVKSLEDFIIENWSSKITLRKGSFNGDPNGSNVYGIDEDLLFDYDSKEFYRKVNGQWQVAFQNDVVAVSGSTSVNPEDEFTIPKVDLLSFDYETGILLEELNPGELKVKLGSHFKTITVDDQPDVVAFGQDTLNLTSGSLINVVTDPETKSISFDLKPEDLTIDYDQIENTPELADVATSGSYNDLLDKPSFSSIATSGSYNDLKDKPDLSALSSVSQIFLVDIKPLESGREVSIDWNQTDSYSISSFSTTTNQVRLEIEVEGGSQYRGSYTANGVPFSFYEKLSPSRRFRATVDLDLQGKSEISIEGNGGSLTIPFSKDSVISLTNVSFDQQSYPNDQTELKSGDLISLQIEADQPFDLVTVQGGDNDALKSIDKAISPSLSSVTVDLEVADRGSLLQQLGTVIRVRSADTASLSSWQSSSNTVQVNNLYPSISWESISYPEFQIALKDSEQATVNYTLRDSDSFSLTSEELTVLSQSSDQSIVELNDTGRSLGYRDSGTNLTLTAERNANGSSSTESQLIEIAHDAPLTSNPNPKFRTSDQPQNKKVNFSFDQTIVNLSLEGSIPEGTFKGLSENANSWTVDIELSNANSHRSSPYPFSVTSINKAGVTSTHELSYRVQGFYPIIRSINTNNTLTVSLDISIIEPENLVITSSSPPVTFYLVESFFDTSDDHKQFKMTSGEIEFNSAIQNFLTGNDPPGQLTVDIEEL